MRGALRHVRATWHGALLPFGLTTGVALAPLLWFTRTAIHWTFPLDNRRVGNVTSVSASFALVWLAFGALYGVGLTSVVVNMLGGNTWMTSAAIAIISLLGAGAAAFLTALIERRTDRRVRDRTRKLTDEILRSEEGVIDVKAVRDRLQSVAGGVGQGDELLIRERLRLYLHNESPLMAQAEAEVIKYIPPLPRNAKRLVNSLRLQFSIASGRGLFHLSVTATHLAKWVVLKERWPELGLELSTRPHIMSELEEAAKSQDVFRALLGSLQLLYGDADDLRLFCVSAPKLGPWTAQLSGLGKAQ